MTAAPAAPGHFEPLVLTEFGEALRQYPGDTLGDALKISEGCLAVHAVCDGFVDCNEVSATHRALSCRRCHLRVVISKELETLGDLRKECDRMLALVKVDRERDDAFWDGQKKKAEHLAPKPWGIFDTLRQTWWPRTFRTETEADEHLQKCKGPGTVAIVRMRETAP